MDRSCQRLSERNKLMRSLTIENNLEIDIYLNARLFETSKQDIFVASLHFEKPENSPGKIYAIGPAQQFKTNLSDNTIVEFDTGELNRFVCFACAETHREIFLKLVSARKGNM